MGLTSTCHAVGRIGLTHTGCLEAVKKLTQTKRSANTSGCIVHRKREINSTVGKQASFVTRRLPIMYPRMLAKMNAFSDIDSDTELDYHANQLDSINLCSSTRWKKDGFQDCPLLENNPSFESSPKYFPISYNNLSTYIKEKLSLSL